MGTNNNSDPFQINRRNLLRQSTLAGLAMLLLTEDLRLQGLAIVIAVLGAAGVSTNTHSSAHYATSDRKWVNDALTLFGYPFFIGMSGTYWRHKHNRVHHSAQRDRSGRRERAHRL